MCSLACFTFHTSCGVLDHIYYILYYTYYIFWSIAGTLLHCGSLYNHNVFLDFILLSKWSPTVLPPLPSLTHSQFLTTQFLLTSQKFMGFKKSKFCLLFFLFIPICMAFNYDLVFI